MKIILDFPKELTDKIDDPCDVLVRLVVAALESGGFVDEYTLTVEDSKDG